MKYCKICKKIQKRGNGSFFCISNEERRLKWSKICGMDFRRHDVVCMVHFASSHVVNTGQKVMLLPNAVPIMPTSEPPVLFPTFVEREQSMSSTQTQYDNLLPNLSSSFISNNDIPVEKPSLFQDNPVLEIPFIKTECRTTYSQTNTRLCGTIQISELADQYRINCFYCCVTFPLEKWKIFRNHLKKKHFEYEEAFKISKYVSTDHDYTPICLPSSSQIEVDPIIHTPSIESTYNTSMSDVLSPNVYYTPEETNLNKFVNFESNLFKFDDSNNTIKNGQEITFSLPYSSNNENIKPIAVRKSSKKLIANTGKSKQKVRSSGVLYLKNKKRQTTNKTALSHCLKRFTTIETTDPLEIGDECEPSTIKSFQQETTELLSEYTARDYTILPYLDKRLESTYNTSVSDVLSPNENIKPIKIKSVRKSSKKLIANTGKSKQKVRSSGVLYLKNKKRQTTNKTALSRCLKRSTTIETIDSLEVAGKCEMTTELSFEYTPRDIINFLLDNMKKYSVLWEFDDEPFNEDYYEAIQELCQLINIKWSLNIDNLKMRRSINRVLKFYCSVYPCENVENVNQFANFYDKCAAFLPKSVNDIAYARCSHCYRCFKNESELKAHLLEEFKYLQWPYKCVQCKECFRESDEYEFHKLLPHFEEVFRCELCNKRFIHRNKYNKHVSTHQIKQSSEPGKYVCNICGKVFKIRAELHGHLIYHGEKKHKCHLCPKSFFTNATLRRHIKSHNKEYDLICEVCGKGFILANNLREHMTKHTGAKVTCNICNLQLRKSSLMRHLRTVHVACEGTIESTHRARCHNYKRILRPMQKRYTRRYRYKYKEKTYFCKICNICFEGHKFILQHNKDFHPDYPKFSCKMCSTEFRHAISLKRHYRQKHMLHLYQVYKLVELGEDVNTVLAIKIEELEKLTETLAYSLNGPRSSTEAHKHTTIINSDPSPDEFYIEEERLHSDTIQDQIMKVADNIAPNETKVDDDYYMNEFFTNILK